jgi:hypothetical protein
MRTLHFGIRVDDLDRSLAFYTAVGYEIVGDVPETGLGHLTMLKLPADEFVTIELVHDPKEAAVNGGTRLSHFVIQVESMDDARRARRARHRCRSCHIARRISRLSNDVDRRSGRQPDRVGPVAGRSRRRHHRGGLGGLSRFTAQFVSLQCPWQHDAAGEHPPRRAPAHELRGP